MRRWPGVIHDDHGAYRLRALLLDDGTLEINYYERRTSVTGGRIVQVFEIDPAGYSSASARSYDSIKLLVKEVYIDSSIVGLGITNCNYWFNAFSNCTEMRGFENLSGMTSANQMFTSCGSLETIYATSFSNSGLSGSLMFNSCNRLVGGTDGFVPSTTSGANVCKLGAADERPHRVSVLLLVLHVARWRQRHRMGQQQDCVHVLPHRHGEHAGVHHDSVR